MSEKQLVYIVEDDASIRELEIYALKNKFNQANTGLQ